MKKYGKATPEALAESALWEASLFEEHGFGDIKISVKHHDPVTMVNAYRIGDTEYAERAKRRVWELHKVGDTELDQRFGEVIAAYETFLTERNDRTTRATRTWQKVRNKGVKQAIIEWVTSKQERQGFIDLVEAGYGDYTIEALVMAMPQEFDADVVMAARKRLAGSGINTNTLN